MGKISIDLRKFIRGTFIVFGLLVVLDFSIGSMLRKLYSDQKSGQLFSTNYVVDSTTADVLVFGSSHANHHYNPYVFEKELSQSFYNCGRDGVGLIYSSALVHSVLLRYKPRFIILDIRPDEFTLSEEGKLSGLLPYHENMAINPFLRYNSNYEKFKLVSQIYPYNSLFTNLIVGLSGRSNKISPEYNGFTKLEGKIKIENPEIINEHKEVDEPKLKVFDDLLALLDSAGIPNAVVISPYYAHYNNRQTALNCLNICNKYKGTRFYNFLNKPISSTPALFYDNSHLNELGSRVFSLELIRQLRNNGLLPSQ